MHELYKEVEEIYRNTSWVMLANDNGIAPERLLLLSLLNPVLKKTCQFKTTINSSLKTEKVSFLTCIGDSLGGLEKPELLHQRSCWKDQVCGALRAFQFLLELVLLCCCSVIVA